MGRRHVVSLLCLAWGGAAAPRRVTPRPSNKALVDQKRVAPHPHATAASGHAYGIRFNDLYGLSYLHEVAGSPRYIVSAGWGGGDAAPLRLVLERQRREPDAFRLGELKMDLIFGVGGELSPVTEQSIGLRAGGGLAYRHPRHLAEWDMLLSAVVTFGHETRLRLELGSLIAVPSSFFES